MPKPRIYRPAVIVVLLLTAAGFSSSNAGDYPLKRRVAPSAILTTAPDGVDIDIVVFKLREGTSRPHLDDRGFLRSGARWEQLNEILSDRSMVHSVQPRFKMEAAQIDRMRAEGSRRIGWQLPDLNLYYQIRLDPQTADQERLEVVNRLNGFELVEIAYFAPIPEILDTEDFGNSDLLTETPGFEHGQYYLQPAPVGMNAYYAWQFPGGRGDNVKVIHVESDWVETHEDLHGGTDYFHIAGERSGDQASLDHGTAVLGIMAADSNSFGMTGIAHNIDLGTVSYMGWTTAEAILTASANADIGDIILTAFGPRVSGTSLMVYVPPEYNQEDFDVILTASALGQIVVEAAANSDQDLGDTDLLDSLFYPEYRFSGAIIAAMSSADHVPNRRTNYGVRIDVHAFGEYDIYTLGWGYLYGTDNDNYYNSRFSGTSASAPEIAGACAVLQGIHKQHYGYTLDHSAMRSLLTTYSTPQVEHEKYIGPMPDLAGSCDAILGYSAPEAPGLLYPANDAYFDLPAQPLLDWDDPSTATSYQVVLDDDRDFNSPLLNQEGITASEVVSPELGAGGYFWRVRAANENGYGLWSEVRAILVGTTIQAPLLVAPDDRAKIRTSEQPAMLTWNAVPGAQAYRLEVAPDSEFENVWGCYYVWYSADGICSYPFVFSKGGMYWRVKAIGDNWPWSETRLVRFIGEKPNAKIDSQTKATVLLTNHPNPFNPYTDVRFSLSQPGHARLEVFNILGQKVSTLVDGNLAAGQHTFTWDGTEQASGIYLYRLTTEDGVASNKMLLVK